MFVLELRFDFDILNYKIFINKFQKSQYSVVSLFMDSGVGFVQSIWFFFFSIEEQK